jgi:hypothetical protein
MDGVTLLGEAREAGLAVTAEGDTLVIRGPKRAEAIALLLIENKPTVMTALASGGADAPWWRRELVVRTIDRLIPPRTPAEAEQLAFSFLVLEWHRRHATRVPRWQCAGCGEPIGTLTALDLADGNRVHLSTFACVSRYGKRWRGAATNALAAMGLRVPAEEDGE